MERELNRWKTLSFREICMLSVGQSRSLRSATKYFILQLNAERALESLGGNVTKSPLHPFLSRLTIISRLARSRITRRHCSGRWGRVGHSGSAHVQRSWVHGGEALKY